MYSNYTRSSKTESSLTWTRKGVFQTIFSLSLALILSFSSTVSFSQLGGGETCALATTIPAIPFLDSGSTSLALDDYQGTYLYLLPLGI